MNAQLTSRDIAVICDVYKYRYLSVAQVQALHFPSKRTTYKRLQILTEQNYLKAFTVPSIPGRVYYLDKAGAEVVAGELRVQVEDLNWHRSHRSPKDYYFLRHFLAINDFRILITKACEASPITLKGFIPEYVGDRTNTGDVKKYIRDRVCDVTNTALEYSHTPDGVFVLEKDGKPALFFLEIDRGTEIISDPERGFLKCVRFYLNYWQEGKYKRFEEDFACGSLSTFRVLTITSSGERIKNIRQAVTDLPFSNDAIKRFLWVTTNRRLTKDTIFTDIWVSMHRDDQNVYRIG
jgi:hypothetical protein